MNYYEHNDKAGADIRYIAMASRESRARYLAALAEYDSGDITLYMRKDELRQRLHEARDMRNPQMALYILAYDQVREEARRERNERNERAAHAALVAGVR